MVAQHIPGQTILAVVDAGLATEVERIRRGKRDIEANRPGILVATDRGLYFYAKKLRGFQLETYPYSHIRNFKYGKNLRGYHLEFWLRGHGDVELNGIDGSADLQRVIQLVQQSAHAMV